MGASKIWNLFVPDPIAWTRWSISNLEHGIAVTVYQVKHHIYVPCCICVAPDFTALSANLFLLIVAFIAWQSTNVNIDVNAYTFLFLGFCTLIKTISLAWRSSGKFEVFSTARIHFCFSILWGHPIKTIYRFRIYFGIRNWKFYGKREYLTIKFFQ